MNHKANVRHHAELLRDSTAALLSQVQAIHDLSQRILHKLESGADPGECPLPMVGDLSVNIIQRHAGKLDLAIELAYYEKHPEDNNLYPEFKD